MAQPTTSSSSTITLVVICSLLFFHNVACQIATFDPYRRSSVVGGERIVGGEEAEEDRYPYVVSLVMADGFFFCAGTLVHPEWVLSAAHCAGYASHVIVGYHNLTNTTLNDFADAERVKVKYEVVHPQFSRAWPLTNDVMMMKLWEPASVDPVTLNLNPSWNTSEYNSSRYDNWFLEWYHQSALWLPWSWLSTCRDDDVVEGTNVTAVGWGRTAEGGNISDVLKELDFTVLDRSECNGLVDEVMGRYIAFLFDLVNRDNLCIMAVLNWTGYEVQEDENETGDEDEDEDEGPMGAVCNGDSGGPIFVKGANASEDVQVGIVSWGVGCDDPSLPSMSADVYFHTDFVEEMLVSNDTFECDFPDDGFDYSACDVPNPCWLNDYICDGGEYNTSECGFDGVDCAYCDFPDDGFNYSDCEADNPCRIGDGVCNKGDYESAACNFDKDDCCTGIAINLHFLGVQICLFKWLGSLPF